MPDPGLLAFVEALERRLTIHRGKEHTLSPPDFTLARRWYDAGVPPGAILQALDQVEASGQQVHSLTVIRSRVEARPRRTGGRRS
jgi:hypothetical protein